jgi:hypothetical protein
MSAARNLLAFPLASDSGALSLPAAGLAMRVTGDTASRAALIDSVDQEQAEERLARIQPLLDYDRDPQLFPGSKSALVDALASRHSLSRRTLMQWQKLYREGGKFALAGAQRADKGRSRWFDANPKAAAAAAYLYLECRQSPAAVLDQMLSYREVLGIREDPSYDTVRRFLASAPPYLTTLARQGRRAYRERMSPYLAAGYADLAPNEVWVADHMIHDVEVANDCFPELPVGAPMRLRFTSIMDRRSRYFVGASWCPEGSSRSIGTALRRAIAQWGPCRLFYCDNGKDFRKVARGARPGSVGDPAAVRGWIDTEMLAIEQTGLLGRLGVAVTRCLPHHPQSKNIERAFGTVHQFDQMWHGHYTAGAPHLRPDITEAAMVLHRKLLRHGRVAESTHPPASFFIAACMAWIELDYHQSPHRGEGMDGLAPAEVFARRETSASVAAESLAVLFWEHERRRVRECAVHLNQRRYTYSPGDVTALDALHARNETDVIVAWDPNDPSEVAVLDDDGRFLCRAVAEDLMRFDPADPEVQARIGESMAARRGLEKRARGHLAAIACAARSVGVVSPVEALAERAQLVPAIPAVAAVLTHRPQTSRPQPELPPMTPAEAARRFVLERRK